MTILPAWTVIASEKIIDATEPTIVLFVANAPAWTKRAANISPTWTL